LIDIGTWGLIYPYWVIYLRLWELSGASSEINRAAATDFLNDVLNNRFYFQLLYDHLMGMRVMIIHFIGITWACISWAYTSRACTSCVYLISVYLISAYLTGVHVTSAKTYRCGRGAAKVRRTPQGSPAALPLLVGHSPPSGLGGQRLVSVLQ
jgi:hypothetical protein